MAIIQVNKYTHFSSDISNGYADSDLAEFFFGKALTAGRKALNTGVMRGAVALTKPRSSRNILASVRKGIFGIGKKNASPALALRSPGGIQSRASAAVAPRGIQSSALARRGNQSSALARRGRGNQSSFLAVRGNPSSALALRGNQSSSLALRGNQSSSLARRSPGGNQSSALALRGNQSSALARRGNQSSLALRGNQSSSLARRGNQSTRRTLPGTQPYTSPQKRLDYGRAYYQDYGQGLTNTTMRAKLDATKGTRLAGR